MRNTEEIKIEYERWLKNTCGEMADELRAMSEVEIEDAFYRDLVFGTGGLRGVIGAGTNRMNEYVVAKASQGLANYLIENYQEASVVIGYDSRINSDVFAKAAAGVFAANGLKVFIWPELLPVPTVSYAVRVLRASAGVMITASHNPSKYNGYKVYGDDGCQITTTTAEAVLKKIKELDCFDDIKNMCFDKAVNDGRVSFIEEDVFSSFIEEEKRQSVLFGDEIDRNVAIVYTPLNGTGLKPVTKLLEETGFSNITVVEEQRLPDGRFPTCPYPNPEIREAMELGLHYCRNTGADLLLATDPDCDRCGIAVRDDDDYCLLSGNEVGLLLLDFVCSQRIKHNRMPLHPVFIKTIVTIDLAEKIATHYGVETVNVLTGFKYIGEVIGRMEEGGRADDYICGFEESYGYLTGTFVRDKDAVNAAFMICEMYAFYKKKGLSLIEKLKEIYQTYGYCRNTLYSYQFEGSAGMAQMASIMDAFRGGTAQIANMTVLKTLDYLPGLDGLPKADVIKFILSDGSVVIRPSGTEPKIKVYISVTADDKVLAGKKEKEIKAWISSIVNRA